MSEDIGNPDYWHRRLMNSPLDLIHQSIYRCDSDTWRAIEENHKRILEQCILPGTSILDCGCGYGRLLSLLPSNWQGQYLGIDLSPDFIRMAKSNFGRVVVNPQYRTVPKFQVWDMRNKPYPKLDNVDKFDLAILISIRPMIMRNQGADVWSQIEANIREVATNILYLEYDKTDKGVIE